jgi:hypothetical protein
MHTLSARDLLDEIESSDLEEAPESVPNLRKLELARAAVLFAIGLAEEVADDTRDENARAYMVDQLKVLASENHGFLSRDFNFDKWIERLKHREDEDDADGDTE